MPEEASIAPLKRKILLFFKEHPQAVETIRGIATWLGEEEKAIAAALEDLVGRRWLSCDKTNAVRGYVLTRETKALAQIEGFLEAS